MKPAACLHNVATAIQLPGQAQALCSRWPAGVREQVNDGAQAQAFGAAGVECRLHVGAAGATVILWIDGEQPQRLDLFLGDHLLWSFLAGPGEHRIPLERFTYPWFNGEDARQALKQVPRRRFAPDLVRIRFPHDCRFGLIDISGDFSPATRGDLPDRTLLCYGSSITQGFSASGCDTSYAARLAELLDLDLLNSGSAGSAHCEAAMADHLASRDDWDVATLEMGINMLGFEAEVFQARVRNMIATVAGPGSTRPVFCLDIFRHFNDLPDRDGATAERFRRIVAEAVASHGGPMCHHIALGEVPSWTGLGADLLHPGNRGMEEMARFLAERIKPVISPR